MYGVYKTIFIHTFYGFKNCPPTKYEMSMYAVYKTISIHTSYGFKTCPPTQNITDYKFPAELGFAYDRALATAAVLREKIRSTFCI